VENDVMAHAYTPGLKIAENIVVERRRILPLKGNVLKKVGDGVRRDEVVARTELPGNVCTVNVVNRLSILPGEIERYMTKREGDAVAKDEVLAETKPFIKWFKASLRSPIAGTVETVSKVTGQVLLREPPIPVEVKAYIDGIVTEEVPEEGVTVRSQATLIQGIFGVGGETWGELVMGVGSPEDVLAPESLSEDCEGKIIVGGALIPLETIARAQQLRVRGLVGGGIHDRDLKSLLGYDLGVAITGSESIGITLVVTEGFGLIPMAERTFSLLKRREGRVASLNGTTQIRAGVMRPEIIIALDQTDSAQPSPPEGREGVRIGDKIRVIREPYFGRVGEVVLLPHDLREMESESKVRVSLVRFNDGTETLVPRANLEVLEFE
jgi:hypothetical protein